VKRNCLGLHKKYIIRLMNMWSKTSFIYIYIFLKNINKEGNENKTNELGTCDHPHGAGEGLVPAPAGKCGLSWLPLVSMSYREQCPILEQTRGHAGTQNTPPVPRAAPCCSPSKQRLSVLHAAPPCAIPANRWAVLQTCAPGPQCCHNFFFTIKLQGIVFVGICK